MDDVVVDTREVYVIDDPGMYGIETVLSKKHVFPLGRGLISGALMFDTTNGRTYFVADADLARYRQESHDPIV